MAKLSERQRLWVTIAVSVVLTGGVTALILMDRSEIQETEEAIGGLDDRISAADAEIRQTKARENEVLVFREVQARELEILPRMQQIADFHSNLTTFLTQAGARFTKLPDNAPKESELARGVFVTPNTIEFEADAASLLRLINMIEIDPRLVAVKGLKVKTGGRTKEGEAPQIHKATLNLETYYYNPPKSQAAVVIPNERERLDDPVLKQRIASFQPERRDTYKLRASSARRDPFVDVRKEVIVEDPEVVRKRFESEEAVVLDLEKRFDDIKEKVEEEKALALDRNIFLRDRVARDVDLLVNELLVRVANATTVKSVGFPELLNRVDKVGGALKSLAATRKELPRNLTVTLDVAQETKALIDEAFQRGDYAEVNSISVAWEQFLRGKAIEPAASPVIEDIKAFRHRAKTLSAFSSKAIAVTGTMVNPLEPAQSVAIIDRKVLHSGDALDTKGEVKVVAIRRDGVDFVFQGEKIFVHREDAEVAKNRKEKAATDKPEPVRPESRKPFPVGASAPEGGTK